MTLCFGLGPMRRLYLALWWILTPVVLGFMALRWRKGKEHPTRYPERFGVASHPRPDGKVIWMHGASVGEVLSLLPLITTIKTHHPDVSVLVTSGTVTSAALVEKRLGSTVIHQFLPLDHPLFYHRFLNHWRPDAVYWTESDLWLGLLGAVKNHALPAFLINARMSETSYNHWRKVPAFIYRILSTFSVIIACDPIYQGRFETLSGQRVLLTPDLKYDTPPPPFSEDQRQALQSILGTSPLWMAASTHDPEEAMILTVHQRLRQDIPTLRLILAPRHPHRREDIKALAERQGLSLAMRSHNDEFMGKDVYLIDTMGEMDLFYSLCPLVFVGGSLIPHGGQNVFEPARHGCAVLHGPHMDNFPRMCSDLGDGLVAVSDQQDLYARLRNLLLNPKHLAQQQEKARRNAAHLRGAAAMIYERTHTLWP